jgi:hypothetical protein
VARDLQLLVQIGVQISIANWFIGITTPLAIAITHLARRVMEVGREHMLSG